MMNLSNTLDHADTPVFVIGAPRSGTTLTGKILGRHSTIYSPGESHFFEDIWTRQKQFGQLQSNTQISDAVEQLTTLFGRYNFPETQALVDNIVSANQVINDVQYQGGGYAALYQSFMAPLAKHTQKSRVCDDTPKHLFYVDNIFQLFPKAKVIACVRDPRDFLCSYKYYWRKSTESDRVKALYHPILTSLLWRTSAKVLLNCIERYDPDRFLWIRYEDLVQSPQETVQRLCTFVNIDFSEQLFAIDSHNSSFGNPNNEAGIFTSSVGRWQNELSSEEIWWVQRLAKSQMGKLGYELHQSSPSPTALVASGIKLPFALQRALRANQHKRGPLAQYLWRRTLAMVGG